MTTICPCSTEELRTLADGPLSHASVAAKLILEDRARRRPEKLDGVSWGKQKPGETAREYIGRMIEVGDKRKERAAPTGKASHRRGGGKFRSMRLVAAKKVNAENWLANLQFEALCSVVFKRTLLDFKPMPPAALPDETVHEYRRRTEVREPYQLETLPIAPSAEEAEEVANVITEAERAVEILLRERTKAEATGEDWPPRGGTATILANEGAVPAETLLKRLSAVGGGREALPNDCSAKEAEEITIMLKAAVEAGQGADIIKALVKGGEAAHTEFCEHMLELARTEIEVVSG